MKANKQKDLLMHYFQLNAQEKKKPISVKAIEKSQSSTAIVKVLIDKKYLKNIIFRKTE
jgi:primosomal protein N' (replication factor Y)